MQEVDRFIEKSGLEFYVLTLFHSVCVMDPNNQTDKNVPYVATLNEELQSLLLVSLQLRLKSLSKEMLLKILDIIKNNHSQFANTNLVMSIIHDCHYLLDIETNEIDYSSSYSVLDWDPQTPIQLLEDADSIVISQRGDNNTVSNNESFQSLSQDVSPAVQTIIPSLNACFTSESTKWIHDQRRVEFVSNCLKEIIQSLNTNPSSTSFITNSILSIPEFCFTVFFDLFFSETNSVSCLQVVNHYLLLTILADPSTLVSRDLFSVIMKSLNLHSSIIIDEVIIPAVTGNNCSKRTLEMVQRLLKASLPPQTVYLLSSQLLALPLEVSSLTLPVMSQLITCDLSCQLDVNQIIAFLSKCVENQKDLQTAQLLNLFRTVLKKYRSQCSSYKEYIQQLVSQLDQKNALTKVLTKIASDLWCVLYNKQ